MKSRLLFQAVALSLLVFHLSGCSSGPPKKTKHRSKNGTIPGGTVGSG